MVKIYGLSIIKDARERLYFEGIRRAMQFLNKNRIPLPDFFTYEEARKTISDAPPFRLLRKVSGGPMLGTGTGLYSHGYLFVNVPVTALPVERPAMRSWSYPGWKTDRTAVGVIAHETGHHVMEWLMRNTDRLRFPPERETFAALIRRVRKSVSGYEPVPQEAWAETMRLFILNPDLLKRAIPERYEFMLSVGLKPSERRRWRAVVDNHHYWATGSRWIGK